MRLLLVEDDKKIASFIEKGLREANYIVDVCHDGLDGLTLALSEPYDVAVLDIMLPALTDFPSLKKCGSAIFLFRFSFLAPNSP